jgi:uridylate kinase
MTARETVIISLGGSLIVPDDVDTAFLDAFRSLLLKHREKRFVIVAGGGKAARRYQAAAGKLGRPSHRELDWIGIRATMLNAELVRVMFGDEAYEKVLIDEPKAAPKTEKRIIVSSGWVPGCSTDKDAAHLAELFSAKTLINLSNIDYAYDKDPELHKDAERIEQAGWKAFRKIVGDTFLPGGNYPFDPEASKLAERMGLTVIIAKGSDLENLDAILSGKAYKGTTIGR